MFSEIFKDGWTTDQRMDGQGQLLRTPLGKPGVQNGTTTGILLTLLESSQTLGRI